MSKPIRITFMILLISVILFPASAYASSKESVSSSHPSFFSSLSSRITSLFTGNMGKSSSSSNNKNDKDDNGKDNGGFWDWLGGKDYGNDWWGDPKNDSNTLWEKYFCY